MSQAAAKATPTRGARLPFKVADLSLAELGRKEIRLAEPLDERRRLEPEPHVAHLLRVLDSLVLRQVEDHQAPARAEHARGFAQHRAGLGDVMEHEREAGR